MKIVPFLVWTECVFLLNVYLSVVSSVYFSLLWKWRDIASVVHGFGRDGRYTPPLVHGLALRTILCAKNVVFMFYFSLNNSWLKMNSQEGSSMGGSARSLSLLIMLEICRALFIFFRRILATKMKSICGASCNLKALTHSALHRLQTKPSHQTPLDLECSSQTERRALFATLPGVLTYISGVFKYIV